MYGSLFHDYKVYYPNLLRNNRYTDHYPKTHRDCAISFPKIFVIVKEKTLLYLMYKKNKKKIEKHLLLR